MNLRACACDYLIHSSVWKISLNHFVFRLRFFLVSFYSLHIVVGWRRRHPKHVSPTHFALNSFSFRIPSFSLAFSRAFDWNIFPFFMSVLESIFVLSAHHSAAPRTEGSDEQQPRERALSWMYIYTRSFLYMPNIFYYICYRMEILSNFNDFGSNGNVVQRTGDYGDSHLRCLWNICCAKGKFTFLHHFSLSSPWCALLCFCFLFLPK